MGLDMCAYKLRLEEGKKLPNVDADMSDENEDIIGLDTDFWYWRKHPDLHGWMERLYREKGGDSPDFNCNNVNVAAEDLDDLEKAVNAESLPSTSGFFFGQSCAEDKEGDLEFIAAARKAIADGYLIYYTSWW